MKKYQKIAGLLLTAAIFTSLTACGGSKEAAGTPEGTTAHETSATAGEGQESAFTLYADFSSGNSDPEGNNLITTSEVTLSAEPTVQEIAQALSDWTGLDFALGDVTEAEGVVTIDWAADSTLIAGLGDTEMKEDFHFYDVDSLNWFMMDSLRTTLLESYGATDVYYTMDGGQTLAFEAMYPVTEFPSDMPYMGSAFYFNHADNMGDLDEGVDFSRTVGLWRLDGAEDTASIYMDGMGYFTTYYASGAMEATGYMEYVDEYGDGNGRYDLLTYDGEFLLGFYFDSDTQIHVGNGDEVIYIRADEGEVEYDENYRPSGVLMPAYNFTGTTPVENNNAYYGGYYYADKTEDGYTTIVNCGFKNEFTQDTMDDYILSCLEKVCETEINNLTIKEGTMDSYPAYYLTWNTWENEDTRKWTGRLVPTDNYTYLYAFDTDADFADEMADTWREALEGLTLEFPYE